MTISEKVAYLKGLAEGLDLDSSDTKEAKLISVMIGILEEVGISLDNIDDTLDEFGDEIDSLSDDVDYVEEVLFDDEDEEEDEEDDEDDDFFEVECPDCGATLIIDEDVLAQGKISCPDCGTEFALDLSDEEEDPED